LLPYLENFNYGKFIKQFQLVKSLGKGGFGEVSLVQHKISGEMSALKRIHASTSMPADQVHKTFQEVQSLTKLNHKSIIKLKHAFLRNQELVMFIEYASGGNLYEFLLNSEGKVQPMREDQI